MTVVVTLFVAIAGPAIGSGSSAVPTFALLTRSQVYAARYFQSHPDAAPDGLSPAYARLAAPSPSAHTTTAAPGSVTPMVTTFGPRVFNADALGLPQNEESGAACRTNTNDVLQGTNDYRGLVSATQNFTGYEFSNDGGATIKQDGQLPTVTIGGFTVPSGGDPVDRWSSTCSAFTSDIDFTTTSTGATQASGVVVRSSTAANLGTCSSPATCWPTRRIIDSTTAGANFLDKDWMDVGKSGSTEVVWVTYTKFVGSSAFIEAVRCNLALTSCTAPIQVSDAGDTGGGTKFPQFSYVTIGKDGRVYVTYATFTMSSSSLATMTAIKLKIAAAGGTSFGAAKTVANPSAAIPLGGRLAADDFRVASVPKATVALIGATPRIFVTDEECAALVVSTCDAPQVKVRYSDNSGTSWSTLTFGAAGFDNYFPTISTDTSTTPNKIALGWYTSVNDATNHHRYDVNFASFPADLSSAATVTRVTSAANEPDADPVLGGQFIGDYFEVFAAGGHVWVNFNQNKRPQKLLASGLAVLQQDNYLSVGSL